MTAKGRQHSENVQRGMSVEASDREDILVRCISNGHQGWSENHIVEFFAKENEYHITMAAPTVKKYLKNLVESKKRIRMAPPPKDGLAKRYYVDSSNLLFLIPNLLANFEKVYFEIAPKVFRKIRKSTGRGGKVVAYRFHLAPAFGLVSMFTEFMKICNNLAVSIWADQIHHDEKSLSELYHLIQKRFLAIQVRLAKLMKEALGNQYGNLIDIFATDSLTFVDRPFLDADALLSIRAVYKSNFNIDTKPLLDIIWQTSYPFQTFQSPDGERFGRPSYMPDPKEIPDWEQFVTDEGRRWVKMNEERNRHIDAKLKDNDAFRRSPNPGRD